MLKKIHFQIILALSPPPVLSTKLCRRDLCLTQHNFEQNMVEPALRVSHSLCLCINTVEVNPHGTTSREFYSSVVI